MKLKELASKPQLTKITIDTENIVTKYGEELEFYIYDRLPIETYGKLASLDHNSVAELYNAVKDLILDEDGNPVISGDSTLPLDLMNAAIAKVSDHLGK